MGYMTLIAECGQCGKTFTANPDLVPSCRTERGQLGFCRACVEAANPVRREKGLPEIPIYPGTYEPAPETPADERSYL